MPFKREGSLITAKRAALIIDDFRSGKLGHITLERPEKIIG